jgi:hypothetical protein
MLNDAVMERFSATMHGLLIGRGESSCTHKRVYCSGVDIAAGGWPGTIMLLPLPSLTGIP